MAHKMMQEQMERQVVALESSVNALLQRKYECETTQRAIKDIEHKSVYEGLIPINDYGYMQGTLVHTNEFLVHLGDDYFVERTVHEASAILTRRMAGTYRLHNSDIMEEVKAVQAQLLELKLKQKAMSGQKAEEEDVIEIVEPCDEGPTPPPSAPQPNPEETNAPPQGLQEPVFLPHIVEHEAVLISDEALHIQPPLAPSVTSAMTATSNPIPNINGGARLAQNAETPPNVEPPLVRVSKFMRDRKK